MLHSTLDTMAWGAMSHGARSLYVALKRRVPRQRNRAYISYRQAGDEIGCGRTQASVWFSELQHYGFIVLLEHGCLGVDGKGKAPHWRLTELGTTSAASSGGLYEPPTRDYLRWDGQRFKAPSRRSDNSPERFKTLSRHTGHPVPPSGTVVSRHVGHPKPKVSRHE
jgi:hypothetical protein